MTWYVEMLTRTLNLSAGLKVAWRDVLIGRRSL